MNSSHFYLGKLWDTSQNKLQIDRPLEYDPADLTTHGVVTGMTGSGKTGLCIGLLEEAALQGIPAIMVDPKGDLTNLLLHFPELAPADFEPWIESDAARRLGKTTTVLAAETAEKWKKGLADWDIQSERISALKEAAAFKVYTPGSDAGVPISILASLQAPAIPWEGNREILRERIASTVTAILGLVGLNDIDPVRSREHILLSNVFENAWSQSKDLDLAELILQTQNPPFEKLGVFPVNSFYPEKDRFELAMLLNNFLASPAFQTWMEGEPLDVANLLYQPDGKPRHTIFYLAHLGDTERMFFVTLLYSAVETWMRTQSGTSSLRALLYFDEIVGYLPPVSNPPVKPILMRMLKQARAFGVGLLLATQNPVDVDYKALSNAGTWFIGKLQTDQDKQRLLDGLESASGGLDRKSYDQTISGLGKRVFLVHNVHTAKPEVFQTRWTMNYLAGPLTRAQIPALNQLAGESSISSSTDQIPAVKKTQTASPSAIPEKPIPTSIGSTTRPSVPTGIAEFFLPHNQTLAEAQKNANQTLPSGLSKPVLLYKPALIAQCNIRYLSRPYGVDSEQNRTSLVTDTSDRRGIIRWEDYPYPAIDSELLDRQPEKDALFASLEGFLTDGKRITALEKDFIDWVYRNSSLRLRANTDLKVYAPPEVDNADYLKLTGQAAKKASEAEISKLTTAYKKKIDALQDKLAKEQRELKQDEDELSQRKMEELGTHAENIFGLFTKSRRKVSSSLTKHRLTEQAKSDVDESKDTIADLQKQISGLEAEQNKEVQSISDKWSEIAAKTEEVSLNPLKKDIFSELFGVAWLPVYRIQNGDEIIELPAFRL